MKKAIVIIAAVMAAIGLKAQDTNRFHLTIEASAGLTRFYNYSALSLVSDAKESYTAPTLSLTFGLKDKSTQFGLRYSVTNVRTSALALNEEVTLHNISLLYQRSVMIAPKLELMAGVTTGFSILHNHLAAVGIDGVRYGATAGVETGLRYYISEYSYLSLTAGLDATQTFDSHNRIPDGYDPQTGRTLISGHGMGGICIGIPPKVKKINMPAALIIEGDGPILACYE